LCLHRVCINVCEAVLNSALGFDVNSNGTGQFVVAGYRCLKCIPWISVIIFMPPVRSAIPIDDTLKSIIARTDLWGGWRFA
jgi:hypothetical protein